MKSTTQTAAKKSAKPATGNTATSKNNQAQTAATKPTNMTSQENSTASKTAGLEGSSAQQFAKNAGANSQNSNTQKGGKEKTEKTETPFEKLFQDILKDTLWAEKHIVESLPAMIEAATTESLKEAFEDHLHVTKKQVKRLEKVFSLLGKPAETVKCPVMEALVKEGKRCIEETPEGSMTRDAGLIISAQKIEHYEIAAYGSLVQVALTLGHDDAAELLEITLAEEEDTDYQLSEIAETEVNPMADNDDEDSSEEDENEDEEDEEEDEE